MLPALPHALALSIRLLPVSGLICVLSACGGGGSGAGLPPAPIAPTIPPNNLLDLADTVPADGLIRVSGSASSGRFGVPVAGGFDCDGDGNQDFALGQMLASPLGRNQAGQVSLIFGNGSINTRIDSAQSDSRILTIAGSAAAEATGGEIWMDDVTGDGLGDLLIGRHNFRASNPDRIGAGALSILIGSAELASLAANGVPIDLSAPPANVTILTLVGANALDRLGFWMRSGDLSGDGIADLMISADQEDSATEVNRGAVYLLRGGSHVSTQATIDLKDFGTTPLAGHLLKILPPQASAGYHFGATHLIADLDNNGDAEALIAAALDRAGGALLAQDAPSGSATRRGSNPGGSLFILWDDNFPHTNPWPPGLLLDLATPTGTLSRIDGGNGGGRFQNVSFGEELQGGGDYDTDGLADLFVGDISASVEPNLTRAGSGHIFFHAARLKGLNFSVDNPPPGVRVSTILGSNRDTITGDTSLEGDFDGDGNRDLAVAAPLESPQGRTAAGTIYVFWGQPGPWPDLIDLANKPSPQTFSFSEIQGAHGGTSAEDHGDTLMYSAAGADLNQDGRTDLVINEMQGNGVDPNALDVGNLLVIDGSLVPLP